MKLDGRIENVTFPISSISKEYYLIGIENEFKIFDGKTIIDFKNVKIKESGFLKIEDALYFFQENKIVSVNVRTLEVSTFLEFTCDKLWLINEEFYFLANKTLERREYRFDYFSHSENKVLWSATDKLELSTLSKDYLLFTNLNRTVYARFDKVTGEKLWSLDFSEHKIKGNVFNLNNTLVFATANNDIIGVDIETGKELWRLENINVVFFQVQPDTNYLASLNSNSVGDNWYVVIDPFEGRLLVNKKFENFYFDAAANKACITKTHYYFISNVMGDGRNSERIANLGCINLQTHELEWIEKVGTTDSYRSEYQKPEINGNKIYLLDGEETLHIYEL